MSENGSNASMTSRKSNKTLLKRLGSPRTANEAAKNFQSLPTKLNVQPNASHQDATVRSKDPDGLPPIVPSQRQATQSSFHPSKDTALHGMDGGNGTPDPHPGAQGGNINLCDDASNASGGSRSSFEQQIIQKLADSQIELAKSSQGNLRLQQKMQSVLAKSNQENFKLQQKTLEAIVVGQNLPLVTLKKFNRDPSKFPAFI